MNQPEFGGPPPPWQPGYPPPGPPGPSQPWQPGYPPPGYPPRKRPPSRGWYGLAAGLLALSVLAGVVGIALFVHTIGQSPGEVNAFDSGDSTTVRVDAPGRRMIFAESDTKKHRVRCTITPEAGVKVEALGSNVNVRLNNWQALFVVTVDQPGDYTITCTGHADDRFAVGGYVNPSIFVGPAFAFLGAFGLAAVAVVTWLVTLILRVRRS